MINPFEEPLVQPFSGKIVSWYNFANPSSARNGLEYLITHDLIEQNNNTYYISTKPYTKWHHFLAELNTY